MDPNISALGSTGAALGHTTLTLQPNAHGAANIGPLLGISSFTGSQSSVAAGTAVTLTYSVTGDSYDFIDVVGPVRGGTQTVTPTVTTTYTLNSTNAYGRSTKAVTVTVP